MSNGPHAMRLRSCFILFNYLLAGLGIACLVQSEIITGPLAGLIPTALGLCYVLEVKGFLPLVPKLPFSQGNLSLLILVFLLFGMDLPILEMLVYFLVLILFTRFIFKTEINDYLYGYLIAIVCLLVGALYSRGLNFVFIFLGFYFVLCWCLIFYNMMVERSGSHSSPEQFRWAGKNESPGASIFLLSAGLTLVSLILTTLIFISFPRIGLGMFSFQSRSTPISGFSEKVTLGDVGKIKLNDDVVMRVEFSRNGKPFRPVSRVLWRGVALDHYDGTSWKSTAPAELSFQNRPGKGLNLFTAGRPVRVVRQDVFMEAFDSDVVFTHGLPLRLDGTFRKLIIDQNFVLRTVDGHHGPKKYTLVSDIGSGPANYEFKSAAIMGEKFIQPFLQLPENIGRITRLAEELTGGKTTPSAKAEHILNYLLNNYGYSLEMVKETGESNLDEFLFHRKKGHCEYFASAMVILLRAAGIPSRLVNGFVGVEWNDWGDYMVIRQQHAHSWVEAYIPGSGWTVYDPTPPDPALAPPVWQNPLSQTLDLLRLTWQRYVIRYSLQDQIQLVGFLSSKSGEMVRSIKTLPSVALKDLARYLREHLDALLAASILILLAWMWIRDRGATIFSHYSQAPAAALYARMLQRLEQRGIRKRPHWTHREFLENLSTLSRDQRTIVERVTRFYEQCRFGALPLADAQIRKMRQLIRQL